MSSARYIVGDVHEVLKTLPDNSVDFVLTSPPFLALRSYLPKDHPDKEKEIGSELTPADFIDALLDVVEELDRVLAPHGSIAIELGDTFSGSGVESRPGVLDGSSRWGGIDGAPSLTGARGGTVERKGTGWPLAKSLCLIPESFRWALVYGRNPFNGRQTPQWRARNVVRWVRPNPPVGALGDKFRPATSELVIACKSAKRYFDLDAVREKASAEWEASAGKQWPGYKADPGGAGYGEKREAMPNPAGAPPLDWWKISTEPYPGSHYATYPSALCVTPIKAMCPQRVCVVCGLASERVVERESLGARTLKSRDSGAGLVSTLVSDNATRETLGWTDCGHDNWRNGVVLDPFAGSGTTLAVATGLGRDAIGIDIDSRNVALAIERVGMFLDVVHDEAVA